MKKLPISIVLTIAFLLSACTDLPIETNMSETVADFSFTNELEETVSLEDLAGQWWISDFIFTNCETVCLPMTSNMRSLQKELNEKSLPVTLISYSVDPTNDTPEVLKTYGESYGADFSSWHFLTGYDMDTIKNLSVKSFRAIMKEPDYGEDQVTHDTRFFLVNPEGKVVKSYDGINPSGIDDIIADLEILKEENLL